MIRKPNQGILVACWFIVVVLIWRNMSKLPEFHRTTSALQVSSDRQRFPLVLWSSDFHISPVADIKQIVSSYGVLVIDKSLSGHCHLSNTCERDLRIINKQNGIRLEPCTNDIIRSFYASYR